MAGGRLEAAESFDWKANSVAAEISSWDLPKLLQKLVEATGWQIYVDPEAKQMISTKFKDRPQGEALRLLLGDLNFALLPAQSNGPPRLYVFRTTMQEATQLVKLQQKSRAKPIANELIVKVKPGVNIDELAKKLGAKDAEALAWSAIAEMAGALALSRTVSDARAAAILRNSRANVKARFGLAAR